MRALSSAFADRLRESATTLCHCWRLTRRDGVVLGFTDHDRDLPLGSTLCLAGSGLDASRSQGAVGLGVAASDVQGALQAEVLTDADLASGLYDDASVEIWIVDWREPANAVLMDVATIGEVRRSEFAFVAELRSLAHRFDETRGRTYQRKCAADLGDARCRVDLADARFSVGGTVLAALGAGAYSVSLDRVFESGVFTGGRLVVASGAAAGARATIRAHDSTPAGDVFTVFAGSAAALAPGDRINATAGCDKAPETCADTFGNLVNFRGFPHMPGNDVLVSYPNSLKPVMDGGSLFR